MRSQRTRTSYSLATLLLGTVLAFTPGCGQREEDRELAGLVPEDAAAYIEIASLDSLRTSMQRLGELTAPGVEEIFEEMFAVLNPSGKEDGIDHTRPIGLVTTFDPKTHAPAFLLLIPHRFAEGTTGGKSRLPGFLTRTVSGGYIIFSTQAEYAASESASPLAVAAPGSLLDVRIDLVRLFEVMGPQLETQLGGVEALLETVSQELEADTGMDLMPVMRLYFEGVRALLDSAETLSLTCDFGDDEVSIDVALTVREGSPLSGIASGPRDRVKHFAGLMGDDAAMTFLMSMDMRALVQFLEPYLDTVVGIYPEPMREGMAALVEGSNALYGAMGDEVSGDISFGPQGMEAVYYLRPRDAGSFVELMGAMFDQTEEATSGAFGFTELRERTIDGVTFKSSTMTLDAEALVDMTGKDVELPPEEQEELTRAFSRLYGEGGLPMSILSIGDEVAVVMGGGDDYIRRCVSQLKSGGSSQGAQVQAALAKLKDCGSVILCVLDLPRFMRQMENLDEPGMSPFAGVPFGPDISIPTTFYGGASGRTYKAGLLVGLSNAK